jgi:hypothetical protein
MTSSKTDLGLVFGLAGLTAIPLWLASVVPTTDGPSHLYNAWLVLHFHDAALGAGRYLRINPFVPNWGGVGPLVPLLALLPPSLAEKAYLTAIVVGIVLATAMLASRLGGDPILSGAAVGVLAHGWLFAAGFTGFLASLALGIGVCAAAARPATAPASNWIRACVAAALSMGFGVLYLFHLAGAVLAAGLLALLLAARVRDGLPVRRALEMGAPPLLLLSALLVAHWAGGAGREVPRFRSGPAPGLSRLVELPTGAYWQAYSASDRPVGIALVLLTLGLVAARASGRRPSDRGARWLALGACGILLAYCFVPWAAGGGAFLTDRLVPPLFLLPLPWATSIGLPARRLFRAALVILLVSAVVQRATQYRFWGTIRVALVAQNHALPEGGFLVQPSMPPLPMAVDPLVHVWGRVAIDRRALALDDYEALLVGWFPLSFRPEGKALALAWREHGIAPPGARVLETPFKPSRSSAAAP